jgi:hypothetical protein
MLLALSKPDSVYFGSRVGLMGLMMIMATS